MKTSFIAAGLSSASALTKYKWGAVQPPVGTWCSHVGSYFTWADVNGDGKADMICDDNQGRHWIKLSYGNGQYKDLKYVLGGWCTGGATTNWADVNGDGKADMLCDASNGSHWINISLGNGQFKDLNGPKKTNWCKHAGSKTQWADVNGDGKADMICDDTAGHHWVLLSNGDGTWKAPPMVTGVWCNNVSGAKTSYADVDGDGMADMLCDDNLGRHWIALSEGDGHTFTDMKGPQLTNWCKNSAAVSWVDTNGDGKADLHCDAGGKHWIATSHIGTTSDKKFGGPGLIRQGWCSHAGAKTNWADTNGDGTADMHCDDKQGRHWTIPLHSVPM